ncbi:MAG: sulfite exporter TauE/SafE family protein [Eubacterium sp.]|nr:sulfite exporter TauE/SafE family protein [Eubacterium sp.]
MSKLKLDFTDDAQFEEMLRENLPDTPPNSIALDVTPWRNAMNRILVGLVLCSVTFQFLGLHYFLPTVGMFLLLLGFRTLRNENACFKACWIFTMIRVAIGFYALIINATIYQMHVAESAMNQALSITSALLLVATCFCFWYGLKLIRQRTGVPFKTSAAGALIWWYITMLVLGMLRLGNLFVAVVYVLLFVLIVYCIYKQSYELDYVGYELHSAPVKISNGKLVGILLLVLLVGIGGAYAFGGKYPMDWQQVDPYEHAQVEEIKAELIQKGFPENILADMTAEDIAACEGALRIVVEEEMPDKGETEDSRAFLKITSIGVELPNDEWKLLHHFQWTKNPGFPGTECFLVFPAYEAYPSGGEMVADAILLGDYSGRVLYDKDETRMQSSYHTLNEQIYVTNPMWSMAGESTECFATFSMPRNGSNCRGYVSYTIRQTDTEANISSWANYIHQTTKLVYPAYTAEEYRKQGLYYSLSSYKPFWMVQEQMIFWENEEGLVTPNGVIDTK